MFSHPRKHSTHPQSSASSERRTWGDDCVLLGLLSAEAVSGLGYATFLHSIVPVPCCSNVILKVTGITKLNQI